MTWTWPDEAIAAYVAWQPSAAVGDPHGPSAGRQERRCSRRAYEAEGGFAAVMGHAAQRVEVRAVIAGLREEQVTAPAEIEVPAIGIPRATTISAAFRACSTACSAWCADGADGSFCWSPTSLVSFPTSSSSSVGTRPCRWSRTTAKR